MGQAHAVDIAHRKITLLVDLADLDDRYDVWVIEPGGGLGFDAKSLDFGIRGQLSRQNHFHCHDAVERYLARLVNHPHSAAGNLLQ